MATSLLTVLVLIFCLRGLFLGLNGVIGRIVGIVLGYYLAYSYRDQLAGVLRNNLELDIPIVGFQVISGLLIFVVTLFVTGLVVNLALSMLGGLIPPLRTLTDKDNMSSKVAGAIVNGCLGVAIGLLAIWGYGMLSGKPLKGDLVTDTANRFGNFIFSTIESSGSFSLNNFSLNPLSLNNLSLNNVSQHNPGQSGSTPTISLSQLQSLSQLLNTNKLQTTDSESGSESNTRPAPTSSSRGTAVIVSASDPTRRLSIETVRDIIEDKLETNDQLAPSELQQLIANPEASQQALQQMQNSPQQVQAILNNPQLRELMEILNNPVREN